MRKILFFFFLSVAGILLQAQTTKEEVFDNLNKSGGVYYAYPSTATSTSVPKGYEAFYVSHFGRHGSRYLISDEDYNWVHTLLLDAQQNGALTTLGKDVLNRIETILGEVAGKGGDLSPLGVRQQKSIAKRLYAAYPSIFKNNTHISARSTIVVRCVLSMDAFCEGLKECNPTLDMCRESSNKYMSYLNYHSKESEKYTYGSDNGKEEYRKFEMAHVDGTRMAKSLISDSLYLLKRVNPNNLLWGMYWIAIDMQNIETKCTLFDIFTKQELFDLWQTFNYRFYVNDGNYKGNKGMMLANAIPALKNIISEADSVIANKSNGASLRFAHDGNLIPLSGLMRLENCYNSVDDPYQFYKNFSDFKIAPMAGNIQIIFFRNKKDASQVLVKFLLNENEIRIPIPTKNYPFYDWNEVKSFYTEIIKEYSKK